MYPRARDIRDQKVDARHVEPKQPGGSDSERKIVWMGKCWLEGNGHTATGNIGGSAQSHDLTRRGYRSRIKANGNKHAPGFIVKRHLLEIFAVISGCPARQILLFEQDCHTVHAIARDATRHTFKDALNFFVHDLQAIVSAANVLFHQYSP